MARQLWQEFIDRHTPMWEFVEEYDDFFWTDLSDVAEEVRRATYPGGRADVREVETREASTQAEVNKVDESTQTDPPRGRTSTSQTDTEDLSSEDRSVIFVRKLPRASPPRRYPSAPRPPPLHKTSESWYTNFLVGIAAGITSTQSASYPAPGNFASGAGNAA